MLEEIWLEILLNELKITYEGSIKLLCDNQYTISIAVNPIYHHRTKRVDIERLQ